MDGQETHLHNTVVITENWNKTETK